MEFKLAIALLCFIAVQVSSSNVTTVYDFPEKFKFGVATAAFQIEGGWNEDGKGPSIWDTGVHEQPDRIDDRTNGDVTSDSYHQLDRDIEMLVELGVQFYRFSISWARVLSNGDVSSLNKAGVDYYNRLINKLLENSIEPMVTMYHYDLPDELQKIGGMTNPQIVEYFENYADVLYSSFGDRVKLWTTFNEPIEYCNFGYAKGTYPPFISAPGVGEYLCIDHTVKAHASAYRLYKKKYARKQKGKVGIVLSGAASFSRTNDTALIERALQYRFGWIAHPIYSKSGGYPDVMVKEVGENSRAEGRAWSRLPNMDRSWKQFIRGAADFFGLNYYTTRYIELAEKVADQPPSWENDVGIKESVDPSWKKAKSDWLYSSPGGLLKTLQWLKKEYNNVEVYIAENGWSDGGQLDDDDRIEYLQDHLREVSQAIKDGCNVSGYAHWSLMDNFEWLRGYTERFGLYYVNITTPERTRTAKKSVAAYRDIISSRQV
ncbi:unnamed protein product [Hermetia illucens]|uniref:Beta-glucosidase n=1 Tax=Hermetia illucens TaxID=343691 RepID=A0A7R8V143_HERIL|nr:myrosinase 1-like [Hermetia illucens]CAD7089709.1 unnamed protein product [Hermetia illucens]